LLLLLQVVFYEGVHDHGFVAASLFCLGTGGRAAFQTQLFVSQHLVLVLGRLQSLLGRRTVRRRDRQIHFIGSGVRLLLAQRGLKNLFLRLPRPVKEALIVGSVRDDHRHIHVVLRSWHLVLSNVDAHVFLVSSPLFGSQRLGFRVGLGDL